MARTKPHSVRFDEDDYDFICKREQLKSAQSIMDFFILNYMKLYKVEKVSIFTQPKTDIQKEFSERQMSNNINGLSNLGSVPLRENSPIKIKRTFENYLSLKRECECEEDWMKLKNEINNSDLSLKQKQLLLN